MTRDVLFLKQRGAENKIPIKLEIKKAANGNLLAVVEFTTGTNFWKHDNDTYTFVPTKAEADLIRDGIELCDTYNGLKGNFRRFQRGGPD
jgi:hypothetical protein